MVNEMGKINVLEKHIAELIAAGEVVERPCSVIKELLENSIDAGAKVITVEIKNGGVTYMRVTDDGCGILRDDVKKAFLKNATSKISIKDDLYKICTLGFRGEALASVCAVSKVELITKEASEIDGSHYVIEAGEEILLEDFGCSDGTTIIVRDLFYNVPARMKFLKKDVSEANAISKLIDRISLSHPEIKFKFIRDGKEALSTPGDGKIESSIHSVYGRDFISSLMPIDYTLNGLSVNGYISKPSFSRANRNMQHFFINSRYVRTKTAIAALEEAFKGSIMTQKFPSCVLYINIPFDIIDVNVHPSKMEVRFVDEKQIFQLIYHGVKSSILKNDKVMFASSEVNLDNKIDNDIICSTNVTDKVFKNNGNTIFEVKPNNIKKAEEKNEIKEDFLLQTKNLERQEEFEPEVFIPKISNNKNLEKDRSIHLDDKYNKVNAINNNSISFSDVNTDVSTNFNTIENFDKKCEENFEKTFDLSKGFSDSLQLSLENNNDILNKNYKIIGEVFSTYFIVEMSKDRLLFIDKHAAHERILYEKLKNDYSKSFSQILLVPITVTLEKDEYDAIFNNIDLFKEAGFDLDDFGIGSIIIRTAPMWLSNQDIKDIVVEMAGYILEKKLDINSSYINWLYENIACRSAIKAGKLSSTKEIIALIEKLENDDFRYCPHGRPICFYMKKSELEKKFFRT